jgi:hypothetical protein
LSVYPAHFCHPRKIKKKFSKSENKEIPNKKNIKKKGEEKRTTQRRNIHKSSLTKNKKRPCVGNSIPLTF